MNDYYSHIRTDIAPLLPGFAPRVLEVGCGAGATLGWLRQSGRAGHTTGVEYCADAAAHARQNADVVLTGDAETLALTPLGRFDLILCLDVLEHLRDPWQLLQRLSQQLEPGGQLIVSLPNIRHHSVLMPLLLDGRWQYADAGILDRTHLRFFTRQSACELVESAGLRVGTLLGVGQNWSASRAWRWLGKLRAAEPFCAVQYLIRASAA